MLQRRLKWHFDQFSCFCKEHRHTVTVCCILCYAYWCWLKIHQVRKSPSILGRHKVQLRLQMFTVGDGRVKLFVIIFTWSLPLLQQSTQFARLSYNKADSTSPGKPVSYTFNKSIVQLPTCTENVALPTFVAARHAAALCCCGTSCTAINRYLLLAGPTAANLPHAAAAYKWDRQTDRWTDIAPFHRLCGQCH